MFRHFDLVRYSVISLVAAYVFMFTEVLGFLHVDVDVWSQPESNFPNLAVVVVEVGQDLLCIVL
jgi:hypothetical protein